MATDEVNISRVFNDAEIIIIKIGSSLLVDKSSNTDNRWLFNFVKDCLNLIKLGKKIIIISSGATAAGRILYQANKRFQLHSKEKHASAAVGQIKLMEAYYKAFSKANITTAQILLAIEDTENRSRHTNVRSTLLELLNKDVVTIINENDSLAKLEYKYGDNDRLAARVAVMVSADLIFLLTDIDGFYRDDPKKILKRKFMPKSHQLNTPIRVILNIDKKIESYAKGAKSKISSGGMKSKIDAAKIAISNGVSLVICDGRNSKQPITSVVTGKANYSLFLAQSTNLGLKKKWLASSLNPKGVIIIDDGAVAALKKGKSLLFAGVAEVKGNFSKGDVVEILSNNFRALGITNYDSGSAQRVVGKRSSDVLKILGLDTVATFIHSNQISLKVSG